MSPTARKCAANESPLHVPGVSVPEKRAHPASHGKAVGGPLAAKVAWPENGPTPLIVAWLALQLKLNSSSGPLTSKRFSIRAGPPGSTLTTTVVYQRDDPMKDPGTAGGEKEVDALNAQPSVPALQPSVAAPPPVK